MLHIKCQVFECRPSEVIAVVPCVASWQTPQWPVLVAGTLASLLVKYPDWLEPSEVCRVLDMRIWWRLTSFAVGDGTVDAMVWQIWHEPLVNLSRHCKTGSTFFSELYQLGYRWHCVSSLYLMILHTSFLKFCCKSASTYTRNKVKINMALTCMIFYMWRHT